jgi:uncharacterized membrane protein
MGNPRKIFGIVLMVLGAMLCIVALLQLAGSVYVAITLATSTTPHHDFNLGILFAQFVVELMFIVLAVVFIRYGRQLWKSS